MIANLVGNALEHGDPSSPVTVRLAGTDAAWVISVHNGGPPIPCDVLPNIFDPFRRNAPRTERSKGLGLGLFITQQVVLAHGGKIEVSSTTESGTTFTVFLPRAATEKLASPGGHLLA